MSSACSAGRWKFRWPRCRFAPSASSAWPLARLPELHELLALARDGRVKPMPIEVRPLDAAQQSLDDLRAGRVRGRVVLAPQS